MPPAILPFLSVAVSTPYSPLATHVDDLAG
jgi:hypothetical protein